MAPKTLPQEIPPPLAIMRSDIAAVMGHASELGKLGCGHPFVLMGFVAQQLLQRCAAPLPLDANVDADDQKFHRALTAAHKAFRLEMEAGIELATVADLRSIKANGRG